MLMVIYTHGCSPLSVLRLQLFSLLYHHLGPWDPELELEPELDCMVQCALLWRCAPCSGSFSKEWRTYTPIMFYIEISS